MTRKFQYSLSWLVLFSIKFLMFWKLLVGSANNLFKKKLSDVISILLWKTKKTSNVNHVGLIPSVFLSVESIVWQQILLFETAGFYVVCMQGRLAGTHFPELEFYHFSCWFLFDVDSFVENTTIFLLFLSWLLLL